MNARAAIAIAIVVAAVSAAGCASDPLPDPMASSVDLGDPDKVIAAALETMFSWQPVSEASPNVAYTRAAAYMSEELADEGDDAPEPGPGSQWQRWRADGADITAKVYFVADETPPNSADQVHRVAVVVQSATTSDRRLIDEIRQTAWVTATRSDNRWRISDLEF